MFIVVYKWEFVELLRLVGASEILAVARVKSCLSARLNQPCRLVKLPAQRAVKSSAGIRLRPAGYAETGTSAGVAAMQGLVLRAFRARVLSVVLASLIPRQRRQTQHFVDCKL